LSSTEFRRLAEEPLQKVLKRKVLHVALCLALLIPLTPWFVEGGARLGLDPRQVPLLTYAVLALGAALFNSLQIRVPHYRERFLAISREMRRRILGYLKQIAPHSESFAKQVEEVGRVLDRVEDSLTKFVSEVEREYERKFGYIAITFALLSIALSYALFGSYVAYGIVALAVVDSLSAVLTKLLPKPKVFKHSAWSIAITFSVFASVLFVGGVPLRTSILVALAAIVAENLGIEDNLTLPIVTTAVAFVLHAPTPIYY